MKTEKRKLSAVGRALLCVSVLILPLASCDFFGIPEYTLTVTIEPGVTGSPASGVYSYTELEEVAYKYSPVNSLHTVEVLVEEDQKDADDSIIIYTNTSLVARLVDIRGTWDVSSLDEDSNETTFTITFSGADILGGTFTDSRGYTGTWTGPSNVITITYSNWEAYKYTGTLFSMSGTWANGTATGTWSADRAD